MQFDLLRAFPYPVLRPQVNDYVDGDIQANVYLEQVESTGGLKASIVFAVSVPELVKLIKAGAASYVVVFACRDTYFRKAVKSQSESFEHAFDGGSLRGEVMIYPYVVAQREITGFVCPWINDEFGAGPFTFAEGSVLALEEPRSIYVERDAFKPISSAFELVARNNTVNRAILLNSLYFGAVTQCVSYLKQQGGEFSERRWANIFLQKCSDAGISLEKNDEVIVAQKLMKMPFGLLNAHCFVGSAEQ
jgi:hypothetical protein